MTVEEKNGMIIARNRVIPFKGYKCVNICGIVFARNGTDIDDNTVNHEAIHTKQIYELLVIFFYLWYVVEWLIRLVCTLSWKKAYRNIGFEQEAKANGSDPDYIENRKHFAWLKYI